MATHSNTRAQSGAEDFGARVKAFSLAGSKAVLFEGDDIEPLLTQIYAVATCISRACMHPDLAPNLEELSQAAEAIQTLAHVAGIANVERIELQAENRRVVARG